MAETERIAQGQRRSPSQNSSSSRRSQKARLVRSKIHKRYSASSYVATDLTSFPSLSPDSSPEGVRDQSTWNYVLGRALLKGHNGNNALEAACGRKVALENLTTSPPPHFGRPALFDDSVSSVDIPGALHLADDTHIERLLERTGAIKLVRQFARDLAMRDAEISKLRLRADARERELKRMLREVAVSSRDIEHRLYALEHPTEISAEDANEQSSPGIDGLMTQAMVDGVGEQVGDQLEQTDHYATIRPQRGDSDTRSGASSTDSVSKRTRQGSVRTWQEYVFGSASGSRKTSRTNSLISDAEADESGECLRNPGPSLTRRRILNERLFQPPGPQLESGVPHLMGRKPLSDTASGDNVSIYSRKSSRSLTSWTVKLFAGNPHAMRDLGVTNGGSNGTSSRMQDRKSNRNPSTPVISTPKGNLSAMAALKRINSHTGVSTLSGKSSAVSGCGNPLPSRRVTSTNVAPAVNENRNVNENPTNLGPVEMDAILPMESRPPTLTYIYNNYQPGELLTDRFGFIYDQRRKRRQRAPSTSTNDTNLLKTAEIISRLQGGSSPGNENDDGNKDGGANENQQRLLGAAIAPTRSSTPASVEDAEGVPAVRRWQDYLKIATKPTELLSHTPSAAPIVPLTTADEHKLRSSSIAIDKGGSLSVNSSPLPSPLMSSVVADHPEFAGASSSKLSTTAATKASGNNEAEPVRLLLEQLTELHDSLQRERTKKWNEFLRKVRAERRREGEAAAAAAPERANLSLAMPEASLADGEVVGIAGLGNKGKVGRAKWREFRSLVLGGIPVAHRAKIWAECSGASAMRIPGYYDDLVQGVGTEASDPSVVAQIEMDIHRTLTDNVFFRKGPGVAKLKEVLLAYSRRNPGVGYCQGMNLIAASLLLIMPTAEDAFWILASMIENILPQHYYDHGLLGSRADQQVLRRYITEVLPRLSAHLDDLGIEIEALTFQWFLSIFTDCLSAEALYRVWDVVLCLNVTSNGAAGGSNVINPVKHDANSPISSPSPSPITAEEAATSNGGGGTFLFQVALALLKLNEQQLLTACPNPAAVYTYINHRMTDHAISIDGLIQASEALRNVVRREDVVTRRAAALRNMRIAGERSGGEDRIGDFDINGDCTND